MTERKGPGNRIEFTSDACEVIDTILDILKEYPALASLREEVGKRLKIQFANQIDQSKQAVWELAWQIWDKTYWAWQNLHPSRHQTNHAIHKDAIKAMQEISAAKLASSQPQTSLMSATTITPPIPPNVTPAQSSDVMLPPSDERFLKILRGFGKRIAQFLDNSSPPTEDIMVTNTRLDLVKALYAKMYNSFKEDVLTAIEPNDKRLDHIRSMVFRVLAEKENGFLYHPAESLASVIPTVIKDYYNLIAESEPLWDLGEDLGDFKVRHLLGVCNEKLSSPKTTDVDILVQLLQQYDPSWKSPRQPG